VAAPAGQVTATDVMTNVRRGRWAGRLIEPCVRIGERTDNTLPEILEHNGFVIGRSGPALHLHRKNQSEVV
jgi:hypothetical protein